MIKFKELDKVLDELKKTQGAEQDMRDAGREAHIFLDKRDGQWEEEIYNTLKNRPRYTFDKCNPVVDQITGEIEDSDFTLRVKPAGGQASKETAKTMDGLIRNIRNISNAEHIFGSSARNMVVSGFDAWEVKQAFIDGDSFDQDLIIKKIHNATDRVWYLGSPEEQDCSDAPAAVVLSTVTTNEYEEKFPDGKKVGVDEARRENSYQYKGEHIVIGRILYKKPESIEIVQMNNGHVYKVDEKFNKIVDELAQQGIVEERRRTRKTHRVYSRLFDGGEWLTEPERTVFDYLPVVPLFGNFKIIENKRIWRGVVEKMMDSQRVYNYATSRQIEEGALAPRSKTWMTSQQAEGHHEELQRMNNSSDPIQLYTHVDNQPPPYDKAGAQINQGLTVVAQQARDDLNAAAGLFSANMGNNPGLQSGIAIEQQIDKGNNGTIKWFSALEVGLAYTGKVLLNAIPRVYDSTRSVRILSEDGSFEMTDINKRIQDQQTGEIIELNNLAMGDYDVTCERGLAFTSRRKEAASAFIEMASIDPTIMETAKDVYYSNLDAPGMELIAERARLQLVMNGMIPDTQQTEEEKQRLQMIQQQQQGNQQPDPMMLAAEAEMQKAQAAQMAAQNKQMESKANFESKMAEVQLKKMQLQLDADKFIKGQDDKLNVAAATIDQGQQKIDLQAYKQMTDMSIKLTELEQQLGKQLNAEVSSNMLVFDSEIGDFVSSDKEGAAHENSESASQEQSEDART